MFTVHGHRHEHLNTMHGSDLHDLLQRLVAGSQFGHGEGGGDADGGHEDVGLGGLAESELFVQRQREAAVSLRQLPHSRVGGLGDRLRLRGRILWAVRVGTPVDAARLEGEVSGFSTADVRLDSEDERQECQNQQPISSPHSEQRANQRFVIVSLKTDDFIID